MKITQTRPTVARFAQPRTFVLHATACMLLVVGAGCDDDDYYDDYYGNDVVYDDAYAYDADYMVATGSAFAYDDAWDDVAFHAKFADSTDSEANPAHVLRALVSGSTDVCPGRVTVSPERTAAPCHDGADAQTGIELRFDGCELAGGGTLDGSVKVSSTRSASDENCDMGTTITVHYDAHVDQLSYLAPHGEKIVISSLSASGTYDHAPRTMPKSIDTTLHATIQRFDGHGNETSEHELAGDLTHELSGSPVTITTSANLDATDQTDRGQSAELTIEALKTDASCCHATGGTVTWSRTSSESTEFEFGPSCGAAKRNGDAITLRGCP